MTKIFIDTNIFLDMYRANIQKDIKTIMQFLYQNKKYFITTEQSINEFLRNNSDSGEIMYLIYDIERCIDDYCKRNKEKNNGKLEN